MGLRAGFWKLLSKGEADAVDPDELVELVTVPQFEAPVTVAVLESHGISATVQDAFDLVTKSLTASRVLVRRADLDAAQQALIDDPAGS